METAVVPFLVLSFMVLRYVVRHYDIDPLNYPKVVRSAHYDSCWGNYRSHRLDSIDPVPCLRWPGCCFGGPGQDKGEEASGSITPAAPNQPPPPSRPTHRWHVIARHWLRQTRCRTSGVLPVTAQHVIPR
ncbi:hypothetical protein D4764_13G0007770 [Takifugu flavidus]|uniref:Uncharacterized protein n=1 Tax=Takifugu flavidus TaxID=433684 RepID=A0A5C6P9K5_9TELE|nr:hypothetical protein D4764_13G0007770 [Takifugu flavidus]